MDFAIYKLLSHFAIYSHLLCHRLVRQTLIRPSHHEICNFLQTLHHRMCLIGSSHAHYYALHNLTWRQLYQRPAVSVLAEPVVEAEDELAQALTLG